MKRIDYEAHGKIRFKPERGLFAETGPYPVTFFHLGQLFQSSVKMHEVRGTESREVLYSPRDFDMPRDSVARQLPEDAGFAGFRLQENKRRKDWQTHDWVAFLGASYFRSIGALARPKKLYFTAELPKTRSAKIMRRLLRDIAEGRVLGDTTTLLDPNIVSQIKEQYETTDG